MFASRTDGKIEALRRVDGLSTLSDDELTQLASLADVVDVPAGTRLTREGRRGREAFVIVAGEVRVTRDGDEIARLGPGEFVGEMALLDHAPRSADVTAVGPTRLLVLDPRAFGRMLNTAPGLTRRLLEQVSSRLRATGDLPAREVAHG